MSDLFDAFRARANGDQSGPVVAYMALMHQALSCSNLDTCQKSGKTYCVENCPKYEEKPHQHILSNIATETLIEELTNREGVTRLEVFDGLFEFSGDVKKNDLNTEVGRLRANGPARILVIQP